MTVNPSSPKYHVATVRIWTGQMKGWGLIDNSWVLMLIKDADWNWGTYKEKKLQGTTIHAFDQHLGFSPVFQALHQALGIQNQMRYGLLRGAFSVEHESTRKMPLETCPRAHDI